jgi:hypothetical protein
VGKHFVGALYVQPGFRGGCRVRLAVCVKLIIAGRAEFDFSNANFVP